MTQTVNFDMFETSLSTKGIHMEHSKIKNNILFLITSLLVIVMIIFSLFIGNVVNKAISYILTSLVYWFIFCIPLSFYFLGGCKGIKNAYAKPSLPKSTTNTRILMILAFLPCIGTLFAVFIPKITTIPIRVFGIALLYALINGTVEELFWRGIFVRTFPNKILKGYILPALLFGLWHIALYILKDMKYQGGLATLVGGATFMGFLWGFVVYKTKSIRVVTIAHIITNFFAFSGMIYDNWFI